MTAAETVIEKQSVLNRKDIEYLGVPVKASFVYLFIKRCFDIFCAFFALILLSPVLLITSLCIFLYDFGSPIYKQKRIGLNGEEISIYKFRSMHKNSDQLEKFLTPEQLKEYYKEYKIDNDPRITPIGKFIRKTSIDELPQLLNILCGKLSVVGPRPIVEKELEKYGDAVDILLSVKPGLTGYWQAYARNDAQYEDCVRQKMEITYVYRRSMLFDIKIIFKTFTRVFKGG